MRNDQQGCYSRKEETKKINWIQSERRNVKIHWRNCFFIVALAFVYMPSLQLLYQLGSEVCKFRIELRDQTRGFRFKVRNLIALHCNLIAMIDCLIDLIALQFDMLSLRFRLPVCLECRSYHTRKLGFSGYKIHVSVEFFDNFYPLELLSTEKSTAPRFKGITR